MQTVLITGGSGGIGAELARRLRAQGANVAIVARSVERLNAVADETGAHAFPADVLDAEAFADTVKRIETDVGEIDGFAHAVGSVFLRPLHATSLEDWRTTFETNATSAFIALKAVMPLMMRRRRGSVVLFSTVAASTGLPNHETIAAAKSAIEGLVRSASISYARYGIRVNAVAPALTRTPLSRSLWENEMTLKASVAMHPLGRIGEPGDIAAAAMYFLSDASAWTTGQILGVDGGLSAGSPPVTLKP
ncbi:short-chain dehydrogenase [Vulcanimicrobium alpinum]|uniref:Short-chain dehydrogenase n=1 Tax=Vulcanimicrobium alpinum TaxID=3016050 RepID=A0AAN2C9W1_UNVUL|nr:SDR family oxidoreductase [Vulcanimicrobium alpinum]BDE06719.1 short-chain dehydrogenase [Vulcanimicrobium alpinum]